MNDALGFLFLLAILAAGVWGMVVAFRRGLRAKFLVSYGLLEFPFFMAAVCLGGALVDWIYDGKVDWEARIWSYAIICAVCAVLYIFGFLLGLRKRSRNEGVIGQAR